MMSANVRVFVEHDCSLRFTQYQGVISHQNTKGVSVNRRFRDNRSQVSKNGIGNYSRSRESMTINQLSLELPLKINAFPSFEVVETFTLKSFTPSAFDFMPLVRFSDEARNGKHSFPSRVSAIVHVETQHAKRSPLRPEEKRGDIYYRN